MTGVDRRWAWVAAVLGLLGGLAVGVASVRNGFGGYVSEAGVPGTPFAGLYRGGILTLAGAAAALAVAYRWLVAVAVPLALATPAMLISGSVTCTPGCPLPPYETTTAGDLVHAAGSIAGVGFCALAMATLAWAAGPGTLRRRSLGYVVVGWPLLVGTAVAIAVTGRAPVTGTLERLGLLACVAWLVTVALARVGDHAPAA